MQMLPAIRPNAPSAATRLGKASEPATEGIFQNVLNQTAGQSDTATPKQSTKQLEGKVAKRNATDISNPEDPQLDTAPEETVNQEAQAILAGAQALIPEPSSQAQLLDELAGSAQPVSAANEVVPAQTALNMPEQSSRTNSPSEKATINNKSQWLTGDNQQIIGSLQPGEAATDQSTEVLNTVTPQPASSVSSGSKSTATKPGSVETTVQAANTPHTQLEPDSSPVPEATSTVAGQTNKETQQTIADQGVLAATISNAQQAGLNAPRKTNTAPLGDNRFTQLLGRQDTAMAEPSIVESNTASATADLENPDLERHNFTGLNSASRPATQADVDPLANNGLKAADAKNVIASKEHATQSSTVMASTPAVEGFANEETSVTQSAEFAAQPISPEIANLTGGNIETTGMSVSTASPAFSPVQAAAPQDTTLQPNTGFPIPEQEIMEQIIQRSSLHELGGRRELTIELNPEDLGQVKLNLVQEKDQMQLHLQAQSKEVRDILEKHLPRLQEALQQQGLRLETIQVSADAQRNSTQDFLQRQQQQQNQRNPWQNANRSSLRSEEQSLPAQAAMKSSAQGLSLRI